MPANEAERLVALAETQLLDSEHEAVFDAIVGIGGAMIVAASLFSAKLER